MTTAVPVRRVVGLVEQGIVRQAEMVSLVMRNSAFLLVSIVYLAQPMRSAAGVVFFGALVAWSILRLVTRNTTVSFLVADVLSVVGAALLEPAIVSPEIADPGLAPTRMIAYPAILAIAAAYPKRWSFAVLLSIATATAVGDVILFGTPSAMIVMLVLNWWAATWVRRAILHAGAATDALDAHARSTKLREQVAAARTRFEREQFAILHDTAASTLMMVADRANLDPERLASQAARDVAVLRESSLTVEGDRNVGLAAAVERVSAECETPVELRGDRSVLVPAVIAAAVTAAVREALTNVDRHARAARVIITVADEFVSVRDDGIGFDPAQPRQGFGLRASIDGRMRGAGGCAEINSTIGAGTTVILRWPSLPPEDAGAHSTDVARVMRSYQYGLVVAQSLALISVAFAAFGDVVGFEIGLTLTFVAMLFTAGTIVAVVVHGRFAWSRWVWIAALVVLGLWHELELPDDQLLTNQSWVSQSVGWALAALYAGWVQSFRRVLAATIVLTAMWVAATAILLWRLPTQAVLESAGYDLATVATMQVAAVFFAWLLAESVRRAEWLGDRQNVAETQLAVERALQDDYRRHFETLTLEVIELLNDLANGAPVAEDQLVQARARAEYARLRRLFAQAESFEHPLVQRLRPVLDAGAGRGVDVSFDVQARPPDLHDDAIDPAVAAVGQLLESARRQVRIVVSSSGEQVTLSVVSDGHESASHVVSAFLGDADYQLTVQDSVTWLRVHLPVLVAV